MSRKAFDELESFQKREFVPQSADLTSQQVVIQLFKELVSRKIDSKRAFEKWIFDRSELQAAIDQVGSILYIQMTCQTDRKEFSDAYRIFVEEVIPAVKPLDHQLDQKFKGLFKEFPLDAERYFVYQRNINNSLSIYQEANIPLETQVQVLSQEYQTLSGAMTVVYQGEEKTLTQLMKKLKDPNRGERQRVWEIIFARRYEERLKFDNVFDKMRLLRNKIAKQAGFSNYRDYAFLEFQRYDYGVDECKEYHRQVEDLIVPVWKEILVRRKQAMGVDTLRPWDLQVDPLGQPPLKPFTQVDQLIDGVERIFQRLDPELGGHFSTLKQRGLLDLENRKGKAPGGYQNNLSEARLSFIFMNATGIDEDVRTLLHEAGHSFHSMACRKEPLYSYRHAPMEFCEVASMSMELLGEPYLEEFYSKHDDVERSCRQHWESIVYTFVWVAMIDAFQHWIYENQEHSNLERNAKWQEIYQRFNAGMVDWSGNEKYLDILWHKQLHIFEVPFYYIEYGIAQLGAVQIYLQSLEDASTALGKYKDALRLGGTKPLPDLFRAAGLSFDFSQSTLSPIAQAMRSKLNLQFQDSVKSNMKEI